MSTPDPLGRPEDTAIVPMVVVPAKLIRDSANALRSLVDWSSIQTVELKAYYEALIADLRDALATV